VIVTGTESGKPVRFVAKVLLPLLPGEAPRKRVPGGEGATQGDKETGRQGDGTGTDDANSFIPAALGPHALDALLEQGASPAVRDEIIALSEEYKHHHALYVAAGPGERRRPRTVPR